MPLRLRLASLALMAPLLAVGTGHANPPDYRSTVSGVEEHEAVPEERATSETRRGDLDRRQPRSAPDALRFEPGVFVQQTAHSQASVYCRGRTGQQTLLDFDGIRLNNSVYRQGPNQYLFTVDRATIGSISVVRGGASTRFGSDALSCALLVFPLEAPIPEEGFLLEPRLYARGTTANLEKGGRAELGFGLRTRSGFGLGFLGGVGYRDVGRLESSGAVENPNPNTPLGRLPWVPHFAPDGRTQLGTGFKELTADARLVLKFSPNDQLTLAGYAYRMYDAPRTDQCPPPAAPYDTCLTYEKQFRHLAYASYEGDHGTFFRSARINISWQQQFERRVMAQPRQFTNNYGEDDIQTFGISLRARTIPFRPTEWLRTYLRYGADTYADTVRSKAWLEFTDVKISRDFSRGQYLDKSFYLQGGAWADGEMYFGKHWILRAGGRVAWVVARAAEDPESGSRSVDKKWVPVVGHIGVEWRPLPILSVLANVDHSFRAPNLDDLTSRQVTGPGFQFENPDLGPERSTTFEVGARLRHPMIEADLWAYEMLLHDLMTRSSRMATDCPPGAQGCNAAWSLLQLVNATSLSEVRGVEAVVKLLLPRDFTLRATVNYTWGEGPLVGTAPVVEGLDFSSGRAPLSRIPPLNGAVEAWWSHSVGLVVSAGLRWAAGQFRLAVEDLSDGRIPKYGTPGFAVLDLRAGYRIGNRMRLDAVFENVLDTPYRYHGSSVNGPARGFTLSLRTLL